MPSEIMGCIDWVAHGFEIVHSVFPGWQLKAADAVAMCGVHTALLVGARHDVTQDRVHWMHQISEFSVVLSDGHGVSKAGRGEERAGRAAQRHPPLPRRDRAFPGSEPIAAGEVVTTGTLPMRCR